MHNKFTNQFFVSDKEKQDTFDRIIEERGVKWQYVLPEDLEEMSWKDLISKTNEFFRSTMPVFEEISQALFPSYDMRLMRLTWNERGWQHPMGHPWKKDDQGRTDRNHENQYGYSQEEWLFNRKFRVGDYQYGYIRGVDAMPKESQLIDKLFLFTIGPTGERNFVAIIRNVEILREDEEAKSMFRPIYKGLREEMIQNLRSVNADHEHFEESALFPNVRFKGLNTEIMQPMVESSFLKSSEYTRFVPYILDEDLELVLEELKEFETDDSFWTINQPEPDYKPHIYNDGLSKLEDQLGIGREVESFARLLASSDVSPPIAIALFGKWGSGKSFFMKSILKRVDELSAQEAKRLGGGEGHRDAAKTEAMYCTGIAQIEFNAWSYLDGNLWAGIAHSLFEKLNEYITGQNLSDLERLKVEVKLSKNLELLHADLERYQDKRSSLEELKQQLEQERDHKI
ncbi:MAG: P-loop NTPase fold protein, partial [Bacteroidota bacterium]